MCLDTIDKETKEVTEGWKVFYEKDEKHLSCLFYSISTGNIEYDVWFKDKNRFPIIKRFVDAGCRIIEQKYKPGFHFFLTKKAAESYIAYGFIHMRTAKKVVIKKVKVKKITATGMQCGYASGVAREMLIEA